MNALTMEWETQILDRWAGKASRLMLRPTEGGGLLAVIELPHKALTVESLVVEWWPQQLTFNPAMLKHLMRVDWQTGWQWQAGAWALAFERNDLPLLPTFLVGSWWK